jgi:hypothetical protein
MVQRVSREDVRALYFPIDLCNHEEQILIIDQES